ncbi:unnamed protein product [Closterium sp. NIES-65]|nr:unnamed protein product [Closterium sp. NIES-65]
MEEAAAGDAAEAGVAGTGLAEAANAAELGAALPVETEAAAVAGEMETARVAKPTAAGGPTGGAEAETGAAEVATSATAAAGFEVETEGAAGNAAAFGGDSASHTASFQETVPRFVGRGPAVAREEAPAAAETAAAAVRDASPGEGGVAAGVESAETPAAAVGADTHGNNRRAGGTMGHGTGAAAHTARGRGGRIFRAQPAPRRPGAGLGPGEEEASKEIFLDDESTPRRNNPEPQAREAATGLPRNRVEQGDTATKETDVPSPADLAGDDAI